MSDQWQIYARPLDGGPSIPCDLWVSDDRRHLEWAANSGNRSGEARFHWWVGRADPNAGDGAT